AFRCCRQIPGGRPVVAPGGSRAQRADRYTGGMFSVHGTGIGGGIVIGRARVLESRQRDVPRYRLRPGQLDTELARFETAIEVVRAELFALAEHLPADGPAEARALLDVHVMILDDPSLAPAARDALQVGRAS